MAPNRRKGAGKAAAAAAARRKWKVGDLVLAKVKGFPAWPAMVSEPEKWGYTADWRKVTVHFFGTEQIAFCNPVDVEEFTEEKKASLLGKRHGKGADFVRAVNEIIDCFENLKKQDQVSSVNATEETSVTNENNSEGSLSKPEKDEAPVVTVKSVSTGATNDLNSLTEAAAAAAAEDILHDEMQLEDAPSNKVFKETPVVTYYSTRSKTDVSQSRSDAQRRPARRLRSSSRIDASRFQNSALPSMNNTRSSRRVGANQSHDRSLRRSKRITKSSDDSEGHDVDSSANVSNDSIEENDSEIMSIDSDRQSYNDGSTVDSSCRQMAAEPLSENNGGETGLSDRLEFQTNLIIKKKRQTNRKRHSHDTVVAAKLDAVVSEAEVLKADCFSPCNNEKSVKLPVKDDGDEHLPLVKRARVRMGRPSPTGDQENTSVCREEKLVVVPESHATSSGPLNVKVDAPSDTESVPSNGDQPHFPLVHIDPSKKSQFWESRKVDGEAALPPSKRLHRALEAMSANVAEDSQRASNCLSTVNTHSNGCSTSSFVKCSGQLTESKAVNEVGSGSVKDHRSDNSQFSDSEIFGGSNIEMLEVDSTKVVDGGKISCRPNSSDYEMSRRVYEFAEGAESKRLKMSSNERHAEDVAEHHNIKPDLPSICEETVQLGCNTPALVLSPADCCKIEGAELNEAAKGLNPERSQLISDAILVERGIAAGSANIDAGMQSSGAGGETHERKPLSLVEDDQSCLKSEFAKEAKAVSMNLKVMPSVTPVKPLNDRDHQSFHSNFISDNSQDRAVSVTQSSSSLTDGPDSAARGTPPSSSTCNISASDTNYLENNSSSSPDVQLHLEKAKLAGKSSSKGESLLSFEAAIRSLTRTKESIGRATRIAIDCAKSGFATKVVEILARNLESESSSHKKVDLFFLVDSITQCSRGMKGDGGMYPSAIQPLLPRLLLAAAPPGSSSHENHRQCLKVLRVWQERNIIPEPIIRHHIRELDALCGSYPIVGSRRPQRNERSFDDPIREMEGMLVDEYGSNSSFQLPGFCMPPMLKDDDVGSDSDGESFEAVTPEHNVDHLDGQKTSVPAVEKRGHILEDVEGELEMEDVAPCCEVEVTSSNTAAADHTQVSHHRSHDHNGAQFAPQQPVDVPLASAPLTRSSLPPPPPPPLPLPPPPPHPVPPSAFPTAMRDSVTNGPDSKLYPGYQNLNRNERESMVKQSIFPKVKTTTGDAVHQKFHDDKDFEPHRTRQMPECSNACSFNDQPTPHLSGRANSMHPADNAFSTGFHLRPPHPAPSNQFSYVQEQRIQSRRDNPPPTHPNRFRTRNTENGNFYRDRDRNKFAQRDNVGKGWRPPLPPNSDPCYHDEPRMAHAPISYSGQPREPALPNNRWNFPPPPVNHRHYNPYRPPSGGPIPVANRGHNFWRPR